MRVTVFVLVIIVTFSGCTALQDLFKPTKEIEQPQPTYFTHTIRYEGESLGGIASWYTGRSSNWRKIRDANPGLRINRLQLGQEVQIPDELVIKRDPLPKPKRKAPPLLAGDEVVEGDQESGGSLSDSDTFITEEQVVEEQAIEEQQEAQAIEVEESSEDQAEPLESPTPEPVPTEEVQEEDTDSELPPSREELWDAIQDE